MYYRSDVPPPPPPPTANDLDGHIGPGTGRPGGFVYREPGPGDDFRRVGGRPVQSPNAVRSFDSPPRYYDPPPPPKIPPRPLEPPTPFPPLAPPPPRPYESLSKPALALQQDPKAVIAYASEGLPADGLAGQVMAAAVTGNTKTLALLLARSDVLPDFAGASGITPLMAAAARGHTGAVEMLAAHPLVNLGRGDCWGWTALHFAAALRNGDAVAALLRHEAPPEILTNAAKTAFEMAENSSVEDVFWTSRNFCRYMETINRGHPRLLQRYAAEKSRNRAQALSP